MQPQLRICAHCEVSVHAWLTTLEPRRDLINRVLIASFLSSFNEILQKDSDVAKIGLNYAFLHIREWYWIFAYVFLRVFKRGHWILPSECDKIWQDPVAKQEAVQGCLFWRASHKSVTRYEMYQTLRSTPSESNKQESIAFSNNASEFRIFSMKTSFDSLRTPLLREKVKHRAVSDPKQRTIFGFSRFYAFRQHRACEARHRVKSSGII